MQNGRSIKTGDNVPNQPSSGTTQAQCIGEILGHAEQLLETSLNGLQRERLMHIRKAAQRLAALHPPMEDGQTNAATEGDNTVNNGVTPLEILLAEDNPFTQKLVSRLLGNHGHTVHLATNGQEAVDMATERPYDLILMDIRMPVMDGIRATAEILAMERKSGRSPTPIIAITALVSETDKARIRDAGIDGFHGKPIRATVLFSEIERVITAGQARSAARSAAVQAVALVEDEPDCQLDIDQLLKTVDGDWELLGDVAQLYFTDTPLQVARIRVAIEDNDAAEVREIAHSIKGASGSFGKNRVYDYAFELEQIGRSGDLAQASAILEKLQQAMQILERKMRQKMADQGVLLT